MKGRLGSTREVVQGALQALLHDVGKPLVRLCWRASRGIEKPRRLEDIVEALADNATRYGELEAREGLELQDFKAFARGLLGVVFSSNERGEIHCLGHEAVVEPLMERLGFTVDREVSRVVNAADQHSAAERRDVEWTRGPLTHYETPLLSPFMLASYTGLTTHARARLELDQNSGTLRATSVSTKCIMRPGEPCYEEVRKALEGFSTEDLMRLQGERAWHPIRPLRWRGWSLDYYRAQGFDEARAKSSYLDVTASLLAGLYHIAKRAQDFDGIGLVESILAVLRRSLLYVPSAVYRSKTRVVIPELSLYAHSRAVAAVAQALLHPRGDGGSYRILVVDLRGIQGYIHSQRAVSAAVRALRGRSLVVELAQRAIARLILSELGLTWASVLAYEGGRVAIVIPCLDEGELESLSARVEEAVRREFMGLLGVTVAWTDCIAAIGAGHLYTLNLGDPSTLAGQLYELNARLQERRFTLRNYSGGIVEPLHLKRDPLLDLQVPEEYWVESSRVDCNLLPVIAGDEGAEAIESEGGASLDTLRSLVAGSAAINLALLVEFYTADRGSARDLVGGLARSLGLCGISDLLAFGVVSTRAPEPVRVKVGVISFPELGAVYLLASIDSMVTSGEVPRLHLAVSKALLHALAEGLRSKPASVSRVVVSLVNVPESFTGLADEALSLAGTLESGVSLDWIAVNTFYPVEERGGSVAYKSLDEAVASGVLAAAFMDGDNMGNLMAFMAAGTSRLATASELLANTMGFHAVRMLAASKAGGIYVTYSGGDDSAMFGDLHEVLRWVAELAGLYKAMLPGATISTGVSLGDVKEPLYLLFRRAKESLEKAKVTPLLTLEAPDFKGSINWDEGILNVLEAFDDIEIVLANCENPLRVSGIPYRGSASLQLSLELARRHFNDSTRRSWARRLLLALKPLIDYPTKAGPVEAAAALVQYSYLNERIRDELGEPYPSKLLTTTLGNIVELNYPNGPNVGYERAKLTLTAKLTANPTNLAIHLARASPH